MEMLAENKCWQEKSAMVVRHGEYPPPSFAPSANWHVPKKFERMYCLNQ